MSDNTNSTQERTASIDLDKLDGLTEYGAGQIPAWETRKFFAVDEVRAAIDKGARQAAPEAPASDQQAAAASAICQTCQGSGEGKMLVGGGPDAYEIDSNCSDCGGIGEIATPAATTASADLSKRLRIKAGMITMGERIAWGSDAALMIEAAAFIDGRTAGTAWISVEDRMPENGADVVIVGPAYGDWAKGRYAGIAHHVDGVFYGEDGSDMHPPSHWIAAAPSIATKETP